MEQAKHRTQMRAVFKAKCWQIGMGQFDLWDQCQGWVYSQSQQLCHSRMWHNLSALLSIIHPWASIANGSVHIDSLTHGGSKLSQLFFVSNHLLLFLCWWLVQSMVSHPLQVACQCVQIVYAVGIATMIPLPTTTIPTTNYQGEYDSQHVHRCM